jgi:benzoyl-CoA reductase/2-hydroxyglutaryl-CoA dehydratase subunit BcrC/BadD/HgdB
LNVSNAESKRANLISSYFKKAYERDSKVVYVSPFVPVEIIFAMGAIPFNPGTIGGILAQAKATTKFINIAEQNNLSNDLCSTSRCLIGVALENALPTPDCLLFTSGPCDVDAHAHHTLSQLYEKKCFILDVPLYHDQEEAIKYVENQIKNAVIYLEETLNLRLEPEKLTDAIINSNEAIISMQKINELARIIPCPLTPTEAIDIIASNHLRGSVEMTEIYKERYEELNKKTQDKKWDGNRRPRILWHGLKPFYTNEVFEHLENKCKVEIISEYSILGFPHYGLDTLNPDEPYRSMAKRMLLGVTNNGSVNQYFIRQIPGKLEEYNIDGVIAIHSKGCRQTASLHQMFRDIMSTYNRPFVEIDCDYTDYRDYSFEQIKTRLDAFAELLYGRVENDHCRN